MSPEHCHKLQEVIMLHPDVFVPKTKWEREQFAKNKAEGKAEALVEILAARQVAVSEVERTRILAEQDQSVLSRWLHRALSVTSAAELLSEP
jgi:hypothetical protein